VDYLKLHNFEFDLKNKNLKFNIFSNSCVFLSYFFNRYIVGIITFRLMLSRIFLLRLIGVIFYLNCYIISFVVIVDQCYFFTQYFVG